MKTTVALHGQIFDFRTVERAAEADTWIRQNLADTSLFKEVFPDAHVLASVLGGTRYHVFGEATSFGDEGWIPSARVVFVNEDGTGGSATRELPALGTFPTVAKAQDKAASLQLKEIRKDGSVVFADEAK